MSQEDNQQLKLCYVENSFAYFSYKDPKDVWGDDWDDAPYEHNAGLPYDFDLRVAYDGDWDQPCNGHLNSPWSVQDINNGGAFWLRSRRFKTGKPIFILAGTTLDEFIKTIPKCDGQVYIGLEDLHHVKR